MNFSDAGIEFWLGICNPGICTATYYELALNKKTMSNWDLQADRMQWIESKWCDKLQKERGSTNLVTCENI